MIGATFGLLIYLAVSAQLVQFAGELSPKDRTIAFYAVIAFLAGFSERWAKVVLDVAPPEKPEAKPEPKPEPQPAPERQAGREEQPEPAVPAPTV
jgi:hypothetical protein